MATRYNAPVNAGNADNTGNIWEAECEYIEAGSEYANSISNREENHWQTMMQTYITQNRIKCNGLTKFLLANSHMSQVERTAAETALCKNYFNDFINEIDEKFGEIDHQSELRDYYAEAHGWLGLLYQESEDAEYEKLVEDHYCKAARYNNMQGVVNYANLLEFSNRYHEALISWQHALEFFTNKVKGKKTRAHNTLRDNMGFILNRIGCIYVHFENYDLAVECFSEAFTEYENVEAAENLKAYSTIYGSENSENSEKADVADVMVRMHSQSGSNDSVKRKNMEDSSDSDSTDGKRAKTHKIVLPSTHSEVIPDISGIPIIDSKLTHKNEKDEKDEKDSGSDIIEITGEEYYKHIQEVSAYVRREARDKSIRRIRRLIDAAAKQGLSCANIKIDIDGTERNRNVIDDVCDEIRTWKFKVDIIDKEDKFIRLSVRWDNSEKT
jgi:tetratricopeptide (TPR) repeat protein